VALSATLIGVFVFEKYEQAMTVTSNKDNTGVYNR
jgi:hypothetical protein